MLTSVGCGYDRGPFEFGPDPYPLRLGDPCEPGATPCDIGLVCKGRCLIECSTSDDQDVSCPEGQSCEHLGVCTVPCDPLLQDCRPNWRCVPDFETGVGACLPMTDDELLEPCLDFAEWSCRAGLVCEANDVIVECSGFWGCCTPLCDPAKTDANGVHPSCPPELPNCEAQGDGSLGICRKANLLEMEVDLSDTGK